MSFLGPILLSITPLQMAFGAFYNDFNETHVYHPNWPPHARFHNGQTMSISVVLSLTAMWFVPSCAQSIYSKYVICILLTRPIYKVCMAFPLTSNTKCTKRQRLHCRSHRINLQRDRRERIVLSGRNGHRSRVWVGYVFSTVDILIAINRPLDWISC